MENGWSVLCSEGFDDNDARVVCRQLGFNNGRALAQGSFGKMYGRYIRANIDCQGTEDSILNCTYDKFRQCQKDNFLGYGAVSCYNGSLSQGETLYEAAVLPLCYS